MDFGWSLRLWMIWRHLSNRRRFLNLNILLSIFGMALGVAALVIAMAIVSGYESTLKKALVDSFGHLVLMKRGSSIQASDELRNQILSADPRIRAISPFLMIEAVSAYKGEIQGALIEGIDKDNFEKVVQLRSKLSVGELDLSFADPELPSVVVGKVLAQNLGLDVGSKLKLVVPVSTGPGGQNLRPRVLTTKVTGILSLGRFDLDQRYVMLDLSVLQQFSKLPDRLTGYRMKLDELSMAGAVGTAVVKQLGPPYWYRTWRESNQNLFDAIEYEKPVIFIVVALIVLAAAFNVAGSLYVSVLRRYRDISVLKVLGASPSFVRKLFSLQGLLVGLVGSLLGLLLGSLGGQFLMELQAQYNLFPGDVYRIDHVDLEMRPWDIAAIVGVSLLICWLASWLPARRGSQLKAVEGLRYE